jgi:hypothetical protein
MSLPLYKYGTLPNATSIRIILLHHAEHFDDSLYCTIITEDRSELFRLTDNRRNHYEAVSYAWGVPEFTRTIICDDSSHIKITSNVDVMLRRLRKKSRTRNLWIDALSLNQSDTDEKAQQIPLMGAIYHQAAKVCIWLGDGKEDVKEACALIRTCIFANDSGRTFEDLSSSLPKKWYSIVDSLFSLPWFHRRWVLQEAVQGRTAIFHWNTEKIDLRCVVDGADYLQNMAPHQLSQLESRTIHGLETVRMIQSRSDQWLDLLWNLHHTECLEPHDRLFALYGLAKSGPGIHKPQIDYNVGWKTAFAKFAAECIENGQWYTILRHIATFGSLGDVDDAEPSWVPNWSQPRRRNLPHWDDFRDFRENLDEIRYDGNKHLSLEWNYIECPSITCVFEPSDSDWNWSELLDWLCLSDEENIEDSLTIALMIGGAAFIDPKDITIFPAYTEIRSYLEQKAKNSRVGTFAHGVRSRQLSLLDDIPPRHQQLLLRVAQHLIQRNSLFCSKVSPHSGYLAIGFCPEIVQPGDVYVRSYTYPASDPVFGKDEDAGPSVEFIIRPLKKEAEGVENTVPEGKKAPGIAMSMNDNKKALGYFRLVGASVSHAITLSQVSWSSEELSEDDESDLPQRTRSQTKLRPSYSPGPELKEEEDSSLAARLGSPNSSSSSSSSSSLGLGLHESHKLLQYIIC